MALALQAVRFGSVGVVATALHFGVAYLLHSLSATGPLLASTGGFLIALCASYLGNSYWTFEQQGVRARQFGRYCILAVSSFLVGALIISITSRLLQWPFWAALLAVVAVTPAANLLVARYWVFAARPRRFVSPDLLILTVGLCLAFWFYDGGMLNHDVSWYLIATERWLDGGQLYRDIIEVNPPLAFYLTAPAVWVAGQSLIAAEAAFLVWVLIVIATSLAWARRLLGRVPGLEGRERHLLLAACFVALVIAPTDNFGQREHFLVIFALPLILLVILQPLGLSCSRWERAAIGALAATGIALKPYFLALPAALAILGATRERSWRGAMAPEYLLVAFGMVLYAGFVGVVHPDYVTRIVPIARLVYDTFGQSAYVVLLDLELFAFAFVARAILLTPGTEPARREVGVRLLVVGAAFALAYLVQFKGWRSHMVPTQAIVCIAAAWLRLTINGEMPKRAYAQLVLLLVGLSIVAGPLLRGPYHSDWPSVLAPYVPDGPGRGSFLLLSDNMSIAFPFANVARARSASRYPCQWLIPGAIAELNGAEELSDHRRHRLQEILDFARRTTTDDFIGSKPDLVIVDDRGERWVPGGMSFDYVGFFPAGSALPRRVGAL
jgi:putative flippase GtrA